MALDADLVGRLDRNPVSGADLLAVDGKLPVSHLDPDTPSGAQRERNSFSAFERRRIEIDVLMDGERAVAAVARAARRSLPRFSSSAKVFSS